MYSTHPSLERLVDILTGKIKNMCHASSVNETVLFYDTLGTFYQTKATHVCSKKILTVQKVKLQKCWVQQLQNV